MGSLFTVSVPTRDFEAKLRQKDHQIKLMPPPDHEEKDRVDGEHDEHDEHSRPLRGVQSEETITPPTHSRLGSQHSAGSFDPEVDVYDALADGGHRVKVVVSADSMSIIAANSNSEIEGKRKVKAEDAHAIRRAIDNIFLEKHLEDCLNKFHIKSAFWAKSIDGQFSQVSFTVKQEKAENILIHFNTVGIGSKYMSSLCVNGSNVYYEQNDEEVENAGNVKAVIQRDANKESKWNQFVVSIKSRLTVAQVVQAVEANAVMTFDFIVLIIVAGMIAALGLVDDSSVNVVASMLVSPLMGPIMATTFGTVIRDKELIKIGIMSELVGLLICLVVGLVFGIFLEWQLFDGPWYHLKTWPTDQMVSRSELRSLIVGVMVAIPSGAGVALSILAGNSGSLVGVAISASLLPPAVNCGILWGCSIVIAIKETVAGRSPLVPCLVPLNKFNITFDTGTKIITDDYMRKHKWIYCNNAVREYSLMGIVSFGLTWLNIIVIFLVGVVVLKIKEVAPHTTRTALRRFWKEDLKAVRDSNKAHLGGTMENLLGELEDSGEKDNILDSMKDDQTFNIINRRTGYSKTTSIFEEVHNRKNAVNNSPSTNRDPADTVEEAPASSGTGWGWLFGKTKSKATVTVVSKKSDDNQQKNRLAQSSSVNKIPKLV